MSAVLFSTKLHRDDDPSDEDAKLDEEEIGDLKGLMKTLLGVCQETQLATSEALLEKRLERPPESPSELEILTDAVKAEIQNQLFLHIPKDRAEYFNVDVEWGENFPAAAAELRSAGNCIVAGEPAASVYHSVRAFGVGLAALAEDVGVEFSTPVEDQNWANVINKIEGEIKKKRNEKGVKSSDPKIKFWSNAASHFFAVKEAFRNPSAHGLATHSETRAMQIYGATDQFMEHLSEKLGQP